MADFVVTSSGVLCAESCSSLLARSTVGGMFNSAASEAVSLKKTGGYNRPNETHVKARKSRYHNVTHKLLPLVGIKPQFFWKQKICKFSLSASEQP